MIDPAEVREHVQHLVDQGKTAEEAIQHAAIRFGVLEQEVREIVAEEDSQA